MRAVLRLLEVIDEALVAQDLGDGTLGPRGRHEDLGVSRAAAVADAREHVGDRVGDVHRATSSTS